MKPAFKMAQGWICLVELWVSHRNGTRFRQGGQHNLFFFFKSLKLTVLLLNQTWIIHKTIMLKKIHVRKTVGSKAIPVGITEINTRPREQDGQRVRSRRPHRALPR